MQYSDVVHRFRQCELNEFKFQVLIAELVLSSDTIRTFIDTCSERLTELRKTKREQDLSRKEMYVIPSWWQSADLRLLFSRLDQLSVLDKSSTATAANSSSSKIKVDEMETATTADSQMDTTVEVSEADLDSPRHLPALQCGLHHNERNLQKIEAAMYVFVYLTRSAPASRSMKSSRT